MKPLVTTVNALRELATGLAQEAIASSPVLFEFDGPNSEFLLSAEDGPDVQRVVINRETNTSERFAPEHLRERRPEVMSRVASFAERAKSLPLSLPKAWNQFKKDNLITFFAVPNHDKNSTRWIAEVLAGPRYDVVMWGASTNSHEAELDSMAHRSSKQQMIPELEWAEAIAAATLHFDESRRPTAVDTEMYLPALSVGQPKKHTYDEWLETVSDDQRSFIEASTSKSIRLRGPAGSGKTLALALKAVREVLDARKVGAEVRILVATHSWSLAAQISDSIDVMGVGQLAELDIFPLLEIAQTVLPQQYGVPEGYSLIGDDSFSGKTAQLDQILEVVEEFISGDWVSYRSRVSEALADRLDSEDRNVRLALAWDLLIEFGSVIGAAAIFPGAGSELRYTQLTRARWMLPLDSLDDQKLIFALYSKFMENLESRYLVTPDQVLADFLTYLESHAWNRLRRTEGYDLVFVDEFHLFSPLERQVLHYLTRDVAHYPRLFMAVDPRQSPSEAFIGLAADETWSGNANLNEYSMGDIDNFELTTVHRFSPQILELVKHVHHTFPALELGDEWNVDFSRVESARSDGPMPKLISAASREGQETDIYNAVRELYGGGRIALAVVDMRQWRRFSELGTRIGTSGKFHVSPISGRSEIEGLGYRRHGLVVGSAEYLAGLQFDTVLVAGVPDLRAGVTQQNERMRILSLLYLALSRAEREVRVFVNDEDGGPAEVLVQAVSNRLMVSERGATV